MKITAEFRNRVLAGEFVGGTFLDLGSAITAEMACLVGFEWVPLDHEHGPGGDETMLQQLQAVAATPAVPIVLDLHLKETMAVPGSRRDIPVEGGSGQIDFAGIFRALLAIRFNGVVTYEYERNTPNPVPGLAESIGCVRGTLKTLARS